MLRGIEELADAMKVTMGPKWNSDNFLLGCSFLGCSFLIFLLITRFIGKRNKNLCWLVCIEPLISVALSTLLVFVTKADKHGVKTIQHVKGGMNPSSVSKLQFTGQYVGESARIGFICAIIALAEAIVVGDILLQLEATNLMGTRKWYPWAS